MATKTVDSNALTTLALAQEYLCLSSADGHDDILIELINRTSAGARKYLGFDPLSQEYYEWHDGEAAESIVLRRRPVLAIYALSDEGDDVGVGSSSYSDLNDYIYDPDSAIVRLTSGVFSEGPRKVAAYYAAGYASTPADLQDAVTLWVQDRFANRGTSSSSGRVVKSEAVGDHTITYEDEETGGAEYAIAEDMPKASRAIFNRYRDIIVRPV